jgi:rRNA-processing protein FCF1
VGDIAFDEVVLVLEGGAKAGVRSGRDAHVRVVHAARDGDSEIQRQAREALAAGRRVVVVTADRALAANVTPAQVLSPSWLLDHI